MTDAGVGAESVTSTVKLKVPALAGCPEMAPVAELSDRPPGRLPAAIFQESEPVPPLAWSAVL